MAALRKPPEGRVGVASLDDLNWKQVLDAFTCTECGRCTAVCPATASGTPLAPRQLILDLRDQLYHATTDEPLIPDEVLWSCTTCMACVEACPVGIEHVPTIVDMRRSLVDKGEMDPLLQQTLQNFAGQGNSLGKSARMRARWTKGLDFKIPDARKEPVQYVWFVGDFASFDERAQMTSQAVARVLHDAGVSFGLLYEGERNSGNDVRRIGEEGLFEMLVEQNLSAFADADYRGDLHHRPALAQHAAQRVSGVRPRQAGLPLHRAVRRPRRARRARAPDAADGHARDLPRSVLPGALQPHH